MKEFEVQVYRYDFKMKDSENINVKYLAEPVEGQKKFVEQLKELDIEYCVRSYICSFNSANIMNVCESVIEKGEKKDEEKTDESK